MPPKKKNVVKPHEEVKPIKRVKYFYNRYYKCLVNNEIEYLPSVTSIL